MCYITFSSRVLSIMATSAAELYTKDYLYIQTLSDLYDGVKYQHPIPTERGVLFNLIHYSVNGYIWARNPYIVLEELPLNEGCQIINTRCGTGLAGTYHDGAIPRDGTKISERIYEIYDYLPRCVDNYHEEDETDISDYNNYPLIFYLTESLDLNKVDIKLSDWIGFDEPKHSAAYKVFVVEENDEERDIGRAVMCNLINMMGDQAGIILHVDEEKKLQAFGNYKAPAMFYTLSAFDVVFCPNHYPIIK